MMLAVGTPVLDRRTHAPARVAHVIEVPPQFDLFGDMAWPTLRYVLAFPDGRWADERYADDLELIGADD